MGTARGSRGAGPEAPATRTQMKGSATLGLLVLNPFGKFCQPGLDNVGSGSAHGRVGKSPHAAVGRVPAEGQPRWLEATVACRESRESLRLIENFIDRCCDVGLPRRNLNPEKNAILVSGSDARETPVAERSGKALSPVSD